MSSSRNVIEHNRKAWDELARRKQRFTQAAKDEEFANPLAILDGSGWLGKNIAGKRLLCLAAGGGRQGPLYAATGAIVTVVDVSAAQLELDREVATARRLELKTVQTSMDDLSMFQQGEFDIVIHPVSTCYVDNVGPLYEHVARVTRPGGIYVSQHKQPTSMQASVAASPNGYELTEPYYRSGPLPPVRGSLHREEGTLEYVHRWEQLIGLMCRAGFALEDLTEPVHAEPLAQPGTFAHRSNFVAPYVRVKARRSAESAQESEQTTKMWLPDG
ncbi:MAG: class I SAM-dependent methyltransferase [Planctomycetales bacterium]|nr:class I SAM-dependent methyltransferase [Planctomycetales bacterium]